MMSFLDEARIIEDEDLKELIESDGKTLTLLSDRYSIQNNEAWTNDLNFSYSDDQVSKFCSRLRKAQKREGIFLKLSKVISSRYSEDKELSTLLNFAESALNLRAGLNELAECAVENVIFDLLEEHDCASGALTRLEETDIKNKSKGKPTHTFTMALKVCEQYSRDNPKRLNTNYCAQGIKTMIGDILENQMDKKTNYLKLTSKKAPNRDTINRNVNKALKSLKLGG